MIGRVNAGGGGGLQSTDAILRVIAPAGSTVTISKGGVSKTDEGHVNSDDPLNYDYYFIIHQSQFDNVNPWTISAVTLDQQTIVDTIIIDSAEEYDVLLESVVYLIQNGVPQRTFEINRSSLGTKTYSGQLCYGMTTDGIHVCVANTTETINVTGYSTLHAVIYHCSSANRSGVPGVGVGTSKITTNDSTVSGWAAVNNTLDPITSRTEKTVDITALTGNMYIAFTTAGGNQSGDLYISDLWLD